MHFIFLILSTSFLVGCNLDADSLFGKNPENELEHQGDGSGQEYCFHYELTGYDIPSSTGPGGCSTLVDSIESISFVNNKLQVTLNLGSVADNKVAVSLSFAATHNGYGRLHVPCQLKTRNSFSSDYECEPYSHEGTITQEPTDQSTPLRISTISIDNSKDSKFECRRSISLYSSQVTTSSATGCSSTEDVYLPGKKAPTPIVHVTTH